MWETLYRVHHWGNGGTLCTVYGEGILGYLI